MAQGNRPQAHAVLDEFVAVDVPHVAALTPYNEARRMLGILIVAFGVGMGAARNEGMALLLQVARSFKVHRSSRFSSIVSQDGRLFQCFQQAVFLQHVRYLVHHPETQARTLCDVQQCVLAIR